MRKPQGALHVFAEPESPSRHWQVASPACPSVDQAVPYEDHPRLAQQIECVEKNMSVGNAVKAPPMKGIPTLLLIFNHGSFGKQLDTPAL
jgi:hypothetical protein